jgi:hypothetical protein
MREFSIRFHEDAIGSPHGFALLEALPIPEFPAFPSRPSREPEPLEPLGLCDDREFEKSLLTKAIGTGWSAAKMRRSVATL